MFFDLLFSRIRPALVLAVSTVALPAAAMAEDAPTVQFTADYIADGWSNTRGGVDRGERYIGLLTLGAAVDAEKALGWTGAQFNVSGIATQGRGISQAVGDANGVDNIDTGGVRSVWLYEAWIDQSFSTGTSIRLGVQELNAEFDAGEAKSLFINAAQGLGTDIGQTGLNGPSTYPSTALGARLRQTVGDNAYVQVIALDGVPNDPNFPKRTAFKLNGGEGALLAAEGGLQAGKAKAYLGAWTYTARFADQATGLDHRGNSGVYAHVEYQLAEKLAGFVRAGLANGDFNPFASYFGGGLVYSGLALADDRLGLAIAHARTGASYRTAIGGADKAETNVELTWRAQLCDWIAVQPDVQYIANPGADPALRDALAVGLRLNLALAYPK